MSAKVTKITANTVIAEGMDSTRIGNLVLVGPDRIYGEVMSISGTKATLQVYESTTGLRVGDGIEDLNGPLSVELGPGLLGGIFSGLGRDLGREGNFMLRGKTITTLDHSKKWLFTPAKKKGDVVAAGDIIGQVRETQLITTKIMVPLGLKGVIIDIKEGSFSVDDTVASLKDDSGSITGLKMVQTWPVKTARPFKERKAIFSPLLSGQRVFDAVFPIHKGGTATLPGGFGVGKCVTGETPVIGADGTLQKIEDIYNRIDKTDTEAYKDEEFIRTSNIDLLSLDDSKIYKSGSNLFYKGKSDRVLSIRTRTGRSVRVTPVHKLFKVNQEGEIIETPACELNPGDFISAVRKIDINNKDADIDVYKLSANKVIDGDIRFVVRELSKNAIKNKLKIDVPKWALRGLAHDSILPRVSWVKEIFEASGLPLPKPKLLGRSIAKPTRVPEKMSGELAEFLGYYVSEGHIRNPCTVVFANPDENLLDRFVYMAFSLFGLVGKKEYQKNRTPNVIINSKVLVDFLNGENAGRTAKEKHIPASVIKSSNSVLASFLTAYYLVGGRISRHIIELCAASKDLQLELSYALARFGILHSIRTKHVNDAEYHGIFISGIAEISSFYNLLSIKTQKTRAIDDYVNRKRRGYAAVDIVPLSQTAIRNAYKGIITESELAKHGIKIGDYTAQKEKMSARTFKRFVSFLPVANGNQLQLFNSALNTLSKSLDYIFCDEITSITEETGPFDVYDFSLPESGNNFIGGFGGIVLHNTVSEHNFAKFSNTDISIYVGCGERGNEMADVLNTFPEIIDPRSGKPIMQRTVLIANVSNMPIIAREASIFTGATIAEFYRDMGYSVLLTADSTSRWAEALRQIGSELGEMPVEEGYPASLSSSLASFYSRAGVAVSLGSEDRLGSVTIIGAVSPQGGDFSEPVTQATMRFVDALWELDTDLAHARHYPPVNWTHSYSLTLENMRGFYEKEVGTGFFSASKAILDTLHTSDRINEIASIIGREALPDSQAATLQLSDVIKLYFLQQNAFDPKDAYTPINRIYDIMQLLSDLISTVNDLVSGGVKYDAIKKDPLWSILPNLTGDGDLKKVKEGLEKMKTGYPRK